MAEIARHLRTLIETSGAVSVARFMAEAVGNERHGYYRTRDPFGRTGDFVTAPEISQMFGELLGLWCGAVWDALDRPDPVSLVELGPGRGTLMADALRAVAQTAPEFHRALDVHLIETSPVLRRTQKETLPEADATWHDDLGTVPSGPMLLIANEFFDALPIDQLVRAENGWRDRQVVVDPDSGAFRLRPGGDPTPLGHHIPEALWDSAPGSIFEVNREGLAIAQAIGSRLAQAPGAALIIDYGHRSSAVGETLQAVKNHRFHDIFDQPGAADLTAHVDFQALGAAARSAGADAYGPVDQGSFLRALGIEARRDRLLAKASPEQKSHIQSAMRRLIDADQMGDLFKVLALTTGGGPRPPGFEGRDP